MIATDVLFPHSVSHGSSGRYFTVTLISSGVLLLLDLASLLLAIPLSSSLQQLWLASPGVPFAPAALITVGLAPVILYDSHFSSVAKGGDISPLLRSHVLRLTLFAAVLAIMSTLGSTVNGTFALPRLALWFCVALLLTMLVRFCGSKLLRALHSRGHLSEVVAIVGSGPAADRAARSLQRTRHGAVRLLGIFDDVAAGTDQWGRRTGTIEQLLELGKSSRVDWILLALPVVAEHRVEPLVRRLKALSTPIALCPEHVGTDLPCSRVDYVGHGVPVSLLADGSVSRWDALARVAENVFPRWVVTLALLPAKAIEALAVRLLTVQRDVVRPSVRPLKLEFDDYDLDAFSEVAAGFGQARYGYVVTPNVDHMIRLHESAHFRRLYASARFVLLDSRFMSHVLRATRGVNLPVCTGSDLTAKLLAEKASPDDRLVLVGGSEVQAGQLRERFGLRQLAHFNPPMGFIHDLDAVETCLDFIEAHSPFRFCLLAVGSPQQEILAQRLQERGRARGLALCIGASVNFLTGDERRAPLWLQRCGMEWSYRLLQAPTRMGKRYLVRGPRIFQLLRSTRVILRKAAEPARPTRQSSAAECATVSA